MAVSHGNYQQLVPKTNLCPIHDQIHLLSSLTLPPQPFYGNWLIPFSYLDRGIIQQSPQSARETGQFGCSGFFFHSPR
jgi:hypothetical protein